MADYEVVEQLGDGRTLLRFTSGGLAGRTVVAFEHPEPSLPFRCGGRHGRTRARSPYERAETLLLSLLTPGQCTEWRARRCFRVPSPYGDLEFGRVSDITFWPKSGHELRLCVIPTSMDIPEPDIWTNLLLAFKADPRWFFTVANWRRPRGHWNFGPVPGFETRT